MLSNTLLRCLSGTLLLLAAMGPVEAQRDEPEAVLEVDLIPDRTPEKCLFSNRISGTAVVDDRTVLFYLRSGEVYQNILPRDCPRLKRNDRFMYETFSNRLCSTDMITVLERFGSNFDRGATCRLGEYYPLSESEAEELLQASDEIVRGGDSTVEATPVESPDETSGSDRN
jgi:hypothetical protein